jgi:hypothetical protein
VSASRVAAAASSQGMASSACRVGETDDAGFKLEYDAFNVTPLAAYM